MKVEKDLRLAINAAARKQPEHTWKQEEEVAAKAVQDLFKKNPEIGKKVRSNVARLAKLKAAYEKEATKLAQEIYAFGLTQQGNQIGRYDEAKVAFVKAGGVMPAAKKRKWSADEAVARLVGAKDQKAFDAILKEYGINWT